MIACSTTKLLGCLKKIALDSGFYAECFKTIRDHEIPNEFFAFPCKLHSGQEKLFSSMHELTPSYLLYQVSVRSSSFIASLSLTHRHTHSLLLHIHFLLSDNFFLSDRPFLTHDVAFDAGWVLREQLWLLRVCRIIFHVPFSPSEVFFSSDHHFTSEAEYFMGLPC